MEVNHKPTLAAATISFNEEQDLPGFIDNLKDWVDEIIVVDDGSTDNTAAIAATCPKVKFITHKMAEKDFGNQRNVAMANCTTDWVLHMDVDERVSPELSTEILSSISNTSLNGFKYRRLNFFLHRSMEGGGFQTWNHPQLGRVGKHKFINKIHENCIIEGGNENTGQLKGYMWHLNDVDYFERVRKSALYTKLEADKLLATKKRIKWYHLIVRPICRFCKRYFGQSGYKDGIPGLIFALHCFSAIFKVNALAWDIQNRINRQDIEDTLKANWQKSKL